MGLKIDLIYPPNGNEVLPIEIDAYPGDITVNNLSDSIIGEIIKITSSQKGVSLDTQMRTNEIKGKLVFLFFTYKGRLFLFTLYSLGMLYVINLLLKDGDNKNDIMGEYKGGYFVSIENIGIIDTQTLDMILEGQELPLVQPSKCVIRI